MNTLFNEISKKPVRDYKIMMDLNKQKVEIDIECAEMVRFLNEEGYITYMCCQGHSGNREEYNIWFDNEFVTDEMMIDFLKKVGEWKQFSISFNKEINKYELSEIKRGLNGWVYKRFYYINDKLNYSWIYSSSGLGYRENIIEARKDLEKMKYTIGGKDTSEIYKEMKRKALIKVEMANNNIKK